MFTKLNEAIPNIPEQICLKRFLAQMMF